MAEMWTFVGGLEVRCQQSRVGSWPTDHRSRPALTHCISPSTPEGPRGNDGLVPLECVESAGEVIERALNEDGDHELSP
jgi:hypothetical protein